MPAVSIIINCLNEAQNLRETLDSVFAQTFDDWEIVFWDNASTDGTGEIATSYGERVRYFRSDTTTALSCARNMAYAKCRGKYVAILDGDDLWLPQKLERQLNLFESSPLLGMTFCDSMSFDAGGDRYRLFQLAKPYRGQIFGHLLSRNFIYSSTMMFRREALEHLDHVFDERYSRSADYDLSLRIAYHYPVDYADEALSKLRMRDLVGQPYKSSLIPPPVEIRSVIDNLIEIYPDIRNRYKAELQSFNKGLNYLFAVDAWHNRNSAEARSYLARHLSDKKFSFVYLCTFLMSYKVFNKLKNTYRNSINGRL